MTKQIQQNHTAQIIQFPTRLRANAQPMQQQAAAPLATVDFGDAWYHQEAVEDDGDVSGYKHQQH
jgi:Protein of unknown function (DUF2735)